MAEDYDIVQAIKRIEDELIASMIANLDRHRAEEDELGINWEQWQVKQFAALEEYKRRNQDRYGKIFGNINKKIDTLITIQRTAGNADQEVAILQALKQGAGLRRAAGGQTAVNAQFFRMNDRRMNALIKATKDDLQKAEYAMLRMTNDKYRKIIFNAQMYAASGSATYEKAVDMATKDFLQAGINCVEYKNGARHTVSDYADMAVRTAGKRAYLAGEGEKRKEWGISTVIMNKRGNPCPKCLPFCGKVLIDDVWSGGNQKDGPYPLMSSAIAAGLYHPRCRDGHSTYFPEISEPPDDTYTRAELAEIEQNAQREAQQQYAQRQMEKFARLARYSLDATNREMYRKKEEEWKEIASANDAVRNTHSEVYYNENYDYSIHLDGYEEIVNIGLSKAAKQVAELGGKDKCEHMYLVNLLTGALDHYETNGLPREVGYEFWKYLDKNPDRRFAFVHNHNTDGMFSETDLRTMLSTEQIPVMIAVRNDSVKYIAERKGNTLGTSFYDDLYQDEIDELNRKVRDGIITVGERTAAREKLIVENLLRDYTKGGKLIEQDGRK